MLIKQTYDKEFVELMDSLRKKYGEEIFEIEGIGSQLDLTEFSRQFFSSKVTADASIDENSNVSDNCIIAYKKEASKPLYKLNSLYILWKNLRKSYSTYIAHDIIEKQISGDIYIHDSHMIMMAYCFNFSTLDILQKGLPMVKKIKCVPPKHLCAFKSQIEQFVTIASNSTLGATGLADILVVMSYFVKNILKNKKDDTFSFATEEDCWNYVESTLISMIYTLNQPSRGEQSPFTNISIYDDYFLEETTKYYTFPDFTTPDKVIIKKLQSIFLKAMNNELKRTIFTYPVVTACFAIDENNDIKDLEFAKFIAKEDKQFGFINIFCGKSSLLSSCCRLRSDRNNEYVNSIGGSSSKIGSLGVVTVNLPRLSVKYQNDEQFFDQLKELVIISGKINNSKRKIIQKKINQGYMSLYTYDFMNLDKQYSTTGINGLYECLQYRNLDVTKEDGKNFALKIMKVINDTIDELSKRYKTPHNCEQVPAEGSSPKLAKKDKLLGYNDNYALYSNQFIPLTSDANLLDRIEIQGALDDEFSGGSILHINVESEIENEQDIVELIKLCAKRGVRYFGINYNLQECEDGHITSGRNDKCPTCNKEIVDTYLRVVGFIVSTKNFAKIRREVEYPNRKFYKKV